MSKTKRAKRRANGNGTLILRGGYYYAIWHVNGKRQCRTTKCSDKREAEKKLAEFVRPTQAESDIEKLEAIKARIEDIKNGNLEIGKDKPIMIKFLIDTYTSDLTKDAHLAESTLEIYNTAINKLDEYFSKLGKDKVFQITKNDAEKFLTDLSKQVKPITYNLYLRTLKSLIKIAMKHDNNIKLNPFNDFQSKKIDKSFHRRELTNDEINRLLEAASSFDEDIKTWFYIGAYTGLRRKDSAMLKWKDVDIENRIIRTLPFKTRKTGIVAKIPICNSLYNILSSKNRDSEFVCPNVARKSKADIGKASKAVFDKANVNILGTDANGNKFMETGFHAFRHSLASRLARENVPINQVQMILAHANADMSLYYSHANEKDLKIPEVNEDVVSLKIDKKVYDEVIKNGYSIESALKEWLRGERNKATKEIEDIKLKERQELYDMVDEIMNNDK